MALKSALTALLVLWLGAAQAQEPIRIGSFLAMTGGAAFLGDPEQKTLELYVTKLNAAGGLLGRKVQLFSYDSAGDAEKARTFAKRLIEQDKVDVIVGGSTTGETMAVVPLAEQAGVPFISLAGAVVIVEPVKKWVFKTPHTDRMACEKIFIDMKARGATRVGLISGAGGFDKSMRAECLKVAKNHGIEIVADETYGAADTDMTAQLTKIRQNPEVQAVLNAGFGQGPAIVTKNYRQIGLTLPLYQSHGVASKEFIKLAGDAAEGVRRRPRRCSCRTSSPTAIRRRLSWRSTRANTRRATSRTSRPSAATRMTASCLRSRRSARRARPTGPACATRWRVSGATSARAASSISRRPTTWAWT